MAAYLAVSLWYDFVQGALIQTAQGKFLIQAPAGGQQLPGQLNLSSLSSLGQVQVTSGVGLGQSLGQASGNVALGRDRLCGWMVWLVGKDMKF